MNQIKTYLIAAILGLLSISLPTLFLSDLKQYDSPLFPAVRTGIEGISLWSFLFLFLSGFSVRLFSKISPWKIGLMTMSVFPILAIIEVIVDNTSHRMLPFEIIFYGIFSLAAILGSYLASIIKK